VTTDHDLIVIGLGVAGEQVADDAAEAGMDVLGIERRLVGGECPYWGCIPSKMMVRAGNSLAEAARVLRLAGSARVSPSWQPVVERVRDATDDWDDRVAVDRLLDKGGTFLRGQARLVGRAEVEVDGERHRARRGVVIATGGEPAAPPVEGLAEAGYWTNREAIEARELPASLVVLGAGPIGLELSQTFQRFGTQVTIVEVADRALPTEEPENSEAMGEVLREEGIVVHTGVGASAVRRADGKFTVELADGSQVDGEQLLVATGRRLEVGSLGVEAAGLDPTARSIAVDEHLRAGEGVWAVGDVTGHGVFTHLAVYQARIAVADVLGRAHAPADYRALPRVTFTDPEVASVGMTEAQAREAGIPVRTGVAATASSTRGWIHGPGAEHGVAKLVADADRGVLVGASVMSPAAGEVVGLLVLAIKERVPIAALRELIYPYPTFVRGLEDALRALS
jgi:pyruvate/2-oxoglutarate dehydrogenase complex dihydrolipoamide dehydrogenase (E3) component